MKITGRKRIGFFIELLDYKSAITKFTLKLAEKTVSAGYPSDICYVRKVESAALRQGISSSGARIKWIPSARGKMKLYTAPLGAQLRLLLGNYGLSVSQSMMFKQDVIVLNNAPQVLQIEALARAPFSVVKPELWTKRKKLRAAIETIRFRPGNFKKVLALSKSIAGRTAELFKIDPAGISVIPLGVDSKLFSPELRRSMRPEARMKLGLGDDETVFLYVGDFWKGLEFAILGLAGTAAKKKVKLLALGSFDPEPFKALCARTGVPFTHFKDSDNIRFFYSAADAFLLPTPLDTFALAALEAMAMGLPVILSSQAGLSELLTHGKNALILDDPFDPAGIAEHALALADKEFARGLGEAGRCLAETLTWERTALAHLELYRSLDKSAARISGLANPGVE